MLYFSYGSNMSCRRMRERVPSAVAIGTGILTRHTLAFNKKSKDGSGKCDARATGGESDRVLGVVYRIDPADKKALDMAEGLGYGYEEKRIDILLEYGNYIDAFTYYATSLDDSRKPYGWYMHHVITGAKKAGLPANYLKMLEAVSTVADQDKAREYKELSIYFDDRKRVNLA